MAEILGDLEKLPEGGILAVLGRHPRIIISLNLVIRIIQMSGKIDLENLGKVKVLRRVDGK